MTKTKYRVYANYGKDDTNKFGFAKKEDALKMAKIARKHKGLKWLSVKKVKGRKR
jgi:hypothetical protein